MKKIITIVFSLSVIIAVAYAAVYTINHPVDDSASQEAAEPAADSEKAPSDDAKAALKEKYDIGEPLPVNDDATGNWRMMTIYSSATAEDYIKDFCKTYYEPDKLYVIFNLGLKATTSIKQLAGDIVCVDVYEYVDGEEISAKKIGKGKHLQSFSYDPSTDTIEDLGV